MVRLQAEVFHGELGAVHQSPEMCDLLQWNIVWWGAPAHVCCDLSDGHETPVLLVFPKYI
jgi:hypothetical protein